MNTVIELPKRSLPTALALGAAVGAVFLGVGGRAAMRIFALLTDRAPGWSFGGTMTVVFFGAVFGTIGGLLLWLGRRFFKTTPLARGALFWIPLTLLYLWILSPLNGDSLIAFTPFVVLYGVVLYRIWCRRFVAGWRVHPMMATA
jgi:hypothetical protein